jgi:16S rRNA G1207 methylase RsmC
MDTTTVTLQLPASVYTELQSLAQDEQTDPVEIIVRLVAMARRRRVWLRDLAALREQIRQDGGLQVGTSKDDVVERMRQTRREIFEAEYAHLYR